jgi:hypothetical protein
MPTRFAHDDAIWEDFWHPVIVRLPELGGVGLRYFDEAWRKSMVAIQAIDDALQFEEGGFVPKVPSSLVSVGFWPADDAAVRDAHVRVQVGEKVYVDAPAIALAGGFRVGRIALPVGMLVVTRVNIHVAERGDTPVHLCLGLSLPRRLA